MKSLDGSPSDDADDGAAGGLVADRSAIDLAGGDEAIRDALAALASLGATPPEVPRMLRDFPSGLTLAAVTGTLYALKMYLALLHWNFGDDAWTCSCWSGSCYRRPASSASSSPPHA